MPGGRAAGPRLKKKMQAKLVNNHCGGDVGHASVPLIYDVAGEAGGRPFQRRSSGDHADHCNNENKEIENPKFHSSQMSFSERGGGGMAMAQHCAFSGEIVKLENMN